MINYDRAKELYAQGKSLRTISQELNINRKSLSKKFKEDGIIIRDPNKNSVSKAKRIHALNDSIFEIIDTEEKAYWLGFLYADGYININHGVELCLAECDYEHLVKFQSFMECDNDITYRPDTKSYRISIYSKKVAQDLINLGCFQAKSLILNFPTSEQVPEELIHHFMRGYFDGDGSIATSAPNRGTRRQLRFSILGTNAFLDGYDKRILNVLKRTTPNKRGRDGETYHIQYSGNKQVGIIFDYLYNNSTIYLDRKYTKFIAVLGTNRKDS